MKKKIIILASLVGVVLIFALLIFGGGTTSDKTVTKKEVENRIEKIICEVENENDVEYNIDILSNDMQFDSELKFKQYKKISISKKKEIKTYGVAFIVKSQTNQTLQLTLFKNDESLITQTLTLKGGEVNYADLILEQPIEFLTTDDFYIQVNASDDFIFDSLLIFFEE